MKTVIAKIVALWNAIPPQVQKWLKGLEVAVVTGLIAGFAGAPFADLKTKAGIAKFAGYVFGLVYTAVRLYLAQSPVQSVLKESVEVKQETPAGQTTTVTAEKITQ